MHMREPAKMSVVMSRESKINEGLALLNEKAIINPSLNLWLKTQSEKLSS